MDGKSFKMESYVEKRCFFLVKCVVKSLTVVLTSLCANHFAQ